MFLAAVLSTLAMLQPAPAPGAMKLMWGPNQLPSGQSAFPVYKSLGVDVLQLQLRWDQVAVRRPRRATNPRDGAYRWPPEIDTAVREARANGIRIALMVNGTPGWANGGRSRAYVPRDPRLFADFVRAAATRYRSVRYWMIWGEPTRPGNFLPMDPKSSRGTRLYARMLDRAYSSIKSVDRRDVVIGGMTWTFGVVAPPQYIRWLRLPNGKPPRLDAWGHNPFSRRFPNIKAGLYHPGVRDLNDVDTLEREVAAAYRSRGRRPKLWLSEWTIPSDRANRAFDFFVSRDEQARWISAAFSSIGSQRFILGLGWYSLLDEPSADGSLTTGLMTYEGERKPAFSAYASAK